MSNWRRVDEIITYYGKGVTPKYVDNSSIIVLNQKCVRNNKIDYSFAQFIDDSKVYNEDKILKIGDILINSTGQGTAGRVAMVEYIPVGFRLIVDSHILVLRTNNFFESKCLNYSLFSIESTLQTFMDGSTGQGEFDKIRLFNVNVGYPKDNTIQQKIAKVLSDLDAKIELNSKINAELEAMAKTLYEYWFVQFDFPDTNGKPYKSSGGEMVWNEELKREIPEGWKVKELSKLTDVSNDSLNPMLDPTKEFRHYSIPTFDSTKNYGIEKGKDIRSNKFKVTESDILVSKLNPWFKRVIYPENKSDLICSTEFVVWRTSSSESKNYLFMIANDPSFTTYCTISATGTSNSHKRVNPTVMMRYRIAHNKDVANFYGKKIDSILKTLLVKQKENQELASLRDWLLPMLMNGQVTMGDVEEQLGMVEESGNEYKRN
ncbi:restriction endonuclease subunit S [Flavobacterium profundi]|uniref:restriction endonuclease subunit S n=1 Tax=Flavobacterium profundi TaxID=1774945 RepID=UPI0015E81009|nr:restriction endonuclease subunit S [Flavobacterium profundi]